MKRFIAGALLAYLLLSVHIYHLGGNYNNGGYITLQPTQHFCGIAWFHKAPDFFCDVDY